ncbi:MAG TPA: tetratricopeptide repeat protein [Fontimonas sp.]
MTPCSDARAALRGVMLATLLLLGACASAPRAPSAPARAPTPPVTGSSTAQHQFAAALALMKSGERVAARDAFLELHRAQPTLSGPLTNLGILYAQLGQRGEAMSALARAAMVNPDNAVAHNWLGSLYREGGDFQRAEQEYRLALQADPDYAAAHRNLGVLYEVSLRRPQEALAHYREAQRLGGGNAIMLSAWIHALEDQTGIDVAGASR